MSGDLVPLIVELVCEVAEEQGIELDAQPDVETALFGEQGLFDSMGLVSLVIAVEQAIEERHDAAVALADEKALSQTNSPYRSVGTLAEYAAAQMDQ